MESILLYVVDSAQRLAWALDGGDGQRIFVEMVYSLGFWSRGHLHVDSQATVRTWVRHALQEYATAQKILASESECLCHGTQPILFC